MGEELYCVESPSVSGTSRRPRTMIDNSIFEHCDTLSNLLKLQAKMDFKMLSLNKSKLEPSTRKLVATWMLEVCEERNCEDQVFLVAIHLLDRFTSFVSVQKAQLQLVATVSLLLASKLRQCNYFSVDLLSYYTDNSVTQAEIRQWEILMVAKLGWDLCPVTALDFVDTLLTQLRVELKNSAIRRHAVTFVALAATEPDFVGVKPSNIAGSSILSAIHGLYPTLGVNTIDALAQYLRTSRAELQFSQERLEAIVEKVSKEHCSSSNSSSDDDYPSDHSNGNNNPHHKSSNLPHNKHLSRQASVDANNNICYSPIEEETRNNDSLEDDPNTSSDYEGYETPNDINDINFPE